MCLILKELAKAVSGHALFLSTLLGLPFRTTESSSRRSPHRRTDGVPSLICFVNLVSAS